MATGRNKWNVSSVEEKVQVKGKLQMQRKNADMCGKFGLVNSTIQTI